MLPSSLQIMCRSEVTMFNGFGEYAFTRNTFYDIDFGVKITQNVTQKPLYHLTYAPTKFEAATSNSLGDQGHTKHCPVPSRSCDLCICEVCSFHVQQLRRICIGKKYII